MAHSPAPLRLCAMIAMLLMAGFLGDSWATSPRPHVGPAGPNGGQEAAAGALNVEDAEQVGAGAGALGAEWRSATEHTSAETSGPGGADRDVGRRGAGARHGAAGAQSVVAPSRGSAARPRRAARLIREARRVLGNSSDFDQHGAGQAAALRESRAGGESVQASVIHDAASNLSDGGGGIKHGGLVDGNIGGGSDGGGIKRGGFRDEPVQVGDSVIQDAASNLDGGSDGGSLKHGGLVDGSGQAVELRESRSAEKDEPVLVGDSVIQDAASNLVVGSDGGGLKHGGLVDGSGQAVELRESRSAEEDKPMQVGDSVIQDAASNLGGGDSSGLKRGGLHDGNRNLPSTAATLQLSTQRSEQRSETLASGKKNLAFSSTQCRKGSVDYDSPGFPFKFDDLESCGKHCPDLCANPWKDKNFRMESRALYDGSPYTASVCQEQKNLVGVIRKVLGKSKFKCKCFDLSDSETTWDIQERGLERKHCAEKCNQEGYCDNGGKCCCTAPVYK